MTGRETPDKYIGFFRLVDACERPGCPVCRCLIADARQHLAGLLYEHVTDPESRGRLRASWGFCNWHAWLLRETPNPAFGTAIIYDDLLRLAIERFERAGETVAGLGRGVRGWLRSLGARRRSRRLDDPRRRAVCPACRVLAESEAHYIDTALHHVDDPEWSRAYSGSQGLCVPHALRVLEMAAGTDGARRLMAGTLSRWAEQRRDLQGFIAKHDHQNRRPFTEAESAAYLTAIETLVGAPGLFGRDTDARRSGASSSTG